MTFLCMIALSQNGSPYFSSIVRNGNGRLCQERVLRSRNFATMVTLRQASPLYNSSEVLAFSHAFALPIEVLHGHVLNGQNF